MPVIKKVAKLHWDKLILLFTLFLLCVQNFTPNTYLIGWDNLMPELNIWLNLKRSFFAVWQEYQGLGLVGGMAHATDLIRQLILLPFILILPQNLIRYLWHFSMLFLGTFGIYFGLKKTFKFPRSTIFTASLFYLLNFGTIQYFYNPLETFSTFWGFFPWLIFSLWQYLKAPTSKKLKRLAIINLLAIPGFYVQTLFAVYLICLFLIMLSFRFRFKQFLKITSLIICLNSFWLLPQLYFLSTNLNNPIQGIGNFMSNNQTYDRNIARGNLGDFALLRGYYYDFPDNNSLMMAPWVSHFSNNYSLICGYLLFIFVLVGLISQIAHFKKIKPGNLSLLLLFFLSCLTLLSNTFPFSLFSHFLRRFDLINQIFRSPWTKFIVPASFSFSLLVAFGINTVTESLNQLKYNRRLVNILTTSFFITCLTVFSFPAFSGNFISQKRRINIPAEYQHLFDYLKTQTPSGRIANLPQGSFWGWTNYNWQMTGSGFIWYALPQPILDRAFDAWNLQNEQYYWQLTTALQTRDPNLLVNILDQYNIEFVLFDDSIYFPDDKIYNKISISTSDLIKKTKGLTLEKQFNHIYLYRYQSPTKPFLTDPISSIKPFGFTHQDPAFLIAKDYLVSNQSQISFPFADLFSNRLQSDIPFSVSFDQSQLIVTSNDQTISIPIDYSANSPVNFSPLQEPNITLVTDNSVTYYRLTSQHQQNLFTINFPSADLSQSYLARVEYRHIIGQPLEISIVSQNSKNKYTLTHLDTKPGWNTAWFIIPARQNFNFDPGLNFIFNNQSFNALPTTNNLKSVTLYPFPYQNLINFHTGPLAQTNSPRQYLVSKDHVFYYSIKLPSSPLSNKHLVLPQSFDPGWLTFYFSGLKPTFLKDHVLVNNWANGWFISPKLTSEGGQSTTIYILFWPQLLQFLGFALIPLSFSWILKHVPSKTSAPRSSNSS